MRILFIHQNFPGQFKHLAPALVQRGHEVQALTVASNRQVTSIPTARYKFEPHPYDINALGLARTYAEMVDRGQIVARACEQLAERNKVQPDVVIGHIGWGETLFLKAVWPKTRVLLYSEFFYNPHDALQTFDPEFDIDRLSSRVWVASRQAHLLQALYGADAYLTPTHWQASGFPDFVQPRMNVIHEGIETAQLRPDAFDRVTLPGGVNFTKGDEVITFVSRTLEPYRGYHIFMRALPDVLAARPNAHVVIVGADDGGYGLSPPQGTTWHRKFLDEVSGRMDPARVHFTGHIPFETFAALMCVTRVHAYLSYPFVLSWSMLQAMSCGAHVIGSRTPPVEEVIEDGVNGQLVDFFDVKAWSSALIAALADPRRADNLRTAARKTIVERYDLQTRCLPDLVACVERMAA
ncbi:MAG: glycosyltransferase [Hyphomicrobiaceae bacterium]